MANKKFTSIKNDYELTLDVNSIIKSCADTDKIPKMHYSFVPIEEIGNHTKDDIIDVIGIVIETNPVTTISSKGKELIKRTIIILDITSHTIEVTFWGEKAQNIGWNENEKPVIALKGVKVSDFHSIIL